MTTSISGTGVELYNGSSMMMALLTNCEHFQHLDLEANHTFYFLFPNHKSYVFQNWTEVRQKWSLKLIKPKQILLACLFSCNQRHSKTHSLYCVFALLNCDTSGETKCTSVDRSKALF